MSEDTHRAKELMRGCVVRMSASSGLVGYGNEQCVSNVCKPLGTLSLFGHNQHYKIYDVAKIIEGPVCPECSEQLNPNERIQEDG